MKLKLDPNTMESYPIPPDMSNRTYCVTYANGTKLWFCNQKYHNLEGPAVEYSDGGKKYYIEDVEYSFEEWDRIRKLILFK